MMTLYDYYQSSAAYRVRIALNYKELEYDRHEIHLRDDGGQQHKPAYQAINPQQLVPALVDEGEIVTQSLAILEYLEEKYPTPHILPEDLIARAYVRSIALAVACDIHPLNNLRVLQYIKHTLKHNDEEKTQWYFHWLKSGLTALETKIKNSNLSGKCCYGDTPTMADMCLIPQIYNAKRFEFHLDQYPTLIKIYDHCVQLSYFKEAAPEERES